MSKLVVKQDPANPESIEVIAKNIRAIAEGVRCLRAGPLNDRALFLLIQHAAPISLGVREIKAVFEGIDALDATYLRKAKPA